VEGEAAGGVQQPVAQALGLAAGEFAVQQDGLGGEYERLGAEHELKPGLVEREVAERDGCRFYVN
jgi:hypothetical protein